MKNCKLYLTSIKSIAVLSESTICCCCQWIGPHFFSVVRFFSYDIQKKLIYIHYPLRESIIHVMILPINWRALLNALLFFPYPKKLIYLYIYVSYPESFLFFSPTGSLLQN